ncbi:MAG: SGNH/GDSL hydrolase family protein, partial [Gammaproteobacteria bacterium]
YLWRLVARPSDKSLTPSLKGNDFSKMTGVSFAFGGSGTGGVTLGPGGFHVPGVLAQVQMFADGLLGKKANEQGLYAIWSGANDYLFNGYTEPSGVVGNLATAIETLYGLGARSFLVPNLPDIGVSPLVVAQGMGPQFSLLTQAHNGALNSALDGLAARLPGIQIVRVDVFTLTQRLVAAGYVPAPALEVIAPGSGAFLCLFGDPMTCPDVNLSAKVPGLLFWDALHPTTQVHEQVAKAMYDALPR